MIDSFTTANAAIMNFWADNRDGLSEAHAEKLSTIIASPIMPEKVSHFAEFVYANADTFDEDAKAVARDICLFATSYGFYGLGIDGRGMKIAAALAGDFIEDAPTPLMEMVISSPEA